MTAVAARMGSGGCPDEQSSFLMCGFERVDLKCATRGLREATCRRASHSCVRCMPPSTGRCVRPQPTPALPHLMTPLIFRWPRKYRQRAGVRRASGQAEFLAHHTCKEAADRVLLPIRRLHDGRDRCPLGLSQQGEDGLLLGPAAGRARRNVPRICRPFRAAFCACNLGRCGGFAVRHFRILVGCDGTRRRHHRRPAVAPSAAGQDPGWSQSALISARRQ
jgi:hypothetical protein